MQQVNDEGGFHKGFFGHLTEISNYLVTSLTSYQFYSSYDTWKRFNEFAEGPLENVNVVLETAYEGCAMDDMGGRM